MTETTATSGDRRVNTNGWVTFALVLFVVAGAANIIWGTGALLERTYFEANDYIFGTLTTWGWITLLWGVAQVLVAIGLFQDSNFSRWIAVTVAAISAIFWFMAFPLLPVFALTVIVLDVLVIYGLSAHWDD